MEPTYRKVDHANQPSLSGGMVTAIVAMPKLRSTPLDRGADVSYRVVNLYHMGWTEVSVTRTPEQVHNRRFRLVRHMHKY